MKFFPRSAGRYAILLIILFAIVAVASRFIIVFLVEPLPLPQSQYEDVTWELSLAVLALTMGCLFLAGALGLWAIRSTVESEGRRRIGRFVDTMDYLSDGLVVLDRAGRITGSNPAIRQIASGTFPEHACPTLRHVFPCLSADDMDRLLDFQQLTELERDGVYAHGLRTLRFRSQPSEGVMLVLISDVTDMRSQEIRQRQVAQLRLVGRIAAGMAHDINNILCAISGHATILGRGGQNPEAIKQSVDIILDETKKGSQLSRQLLELSRSGSEGASSERLHQDVVEAAALLRIALSPAWAVKTTIEGQFPAVPLTSAQIEQVIMNLGLLLADIHRKPGTIRITLNKPGPDHLLDVGDRFAAVIIISGEGIVPGAGGNGSPDAKQWSAESDDVGVILSVVRTMVEQARGRMDQLMAPAGLCVYRICLPHLDVRRNVRDEEIREAGDFDRYVSNWQVLLGGVGHELDMLKRHLVRLGAVVTERETVVALLANIETCQALDGIVIDKRMLGHESDGLLKTMVKLCPRVGIVVFGQEPVPEPSGLSSAVVFVPYGANRAQMVRAMVEAKGRSRSVAPAGRS